MYGHDQPQGSINPQPQGTVNIIWSGIQGMRMATKEEIANNEIQKQKEVESQTMLDQKWEEYIEKYSFSDTFSQYLRTGVKLMKKIHYTESFMKNQVQYNERNEDIDQNQLARGVTKYLTNYHFISENPDFISLFWECRNQFNQLDFNGDCIYQQCHCRYYQSKYYQKLWWNYYTIFQRIFFEDVTVDMLDEYMSQLEKYFKKLETEDHFRTLATIRTSFQK